VTGSNGEVITGEVEEFLDSINIPEKILTVFYSTVTGPSVVLPGFSQQSRATVLLDFSRPTVLDFTKFPSLPIPNNSEFAVASNSESWFTALNSRLTQFFLDRRTGYDWLHRPGIYDLLLFFLAVPFALWIDYRIEGWKFLQATSSIIRSSVYVYFFFFALYIYRILFTYSRWVFPKVEMHTDGSRPLGHRTAWAAVMLGIVSGFLWDAIKAMW
jgi:hypothetical protein